MDAILLCHFSVINAQITSKRDITTEPWTIEVECTKTARLPDEGCLINEHANEKMESICAILQQKTLDIIFFVMKLRMR